jgi:N6-L-threonylcarbamoyladenine synthase
MAVGRARQERGLCAAGTNAPSQQMQQVADNDVVALPADVAANLCYAFQDIAFAHVEDRVQKALDWLAQSRLSPPSPSSSTDGACTSLVVVGGVAANKQLRQRLLDLLAAHALSTSTGETPTRPLQLIFPPVRLCTDNGVMPAWTGVEKLLQGISDDPREPEVVARWPLGSMADIPV